MEPPPNCSLFPAWNHAHLHTHLAACPGHLHIMQVLGQIDEHAAVAAVQAPFGCAHRVEHHHATATATSTHSSVRRRALWACKHPKLGRRVLAGGVQAGGAGHAAVSASSHTRRPLKGRLVVAQGAQGVGLAVCTADRVQQQLVLIEWALCGSSMCRYANESS